MRGAKQAKVLSALRNGCETSRDIEAALGSEMTYHQVRSLLSALMRRGTIRKSGDGPGRKGTYTYAIVEKPETPGESEK